MRAARLTQPGILTVRSRVEVWMNEIMHRIRRLVRPERPFRTVFEEATEGIMIHEPDTGEMVAVNPRACEMFGYDREEIDDLTLDDLIAGRPPYDSDRASQVTDKVLHEGPQTVEWQYERRDGTAFWGEVKLKTIQFRNEQRVLGLVSDVSDRKHYEEALREAEQSARKANQFKSAILKNLSHAVRTPLTSILGYAEILEKKAEGEMRSFAARIRKSSQRLRDTYDAVLDLAALEASTRELTYERTDVGTFVERVVRTYEPRADAEGVPLAFEPPEVSVVGQFDRDGLKRIVEELLDNALTFTGTGGTVRVEVTPRPEAVDIEVTDSGAGIPASFQPRLFDAFAQRSQENGARSQGAGIGLTIVKGLVDLMGGTVDVESGVGEGTRVTVRLPMK